MVFTSSIFLIYFLPLLLACYFIIPGRFLVLKNLVLFAFSIVFYSWGGTGYLILFASSMVANYVGGILVGALENKLWRKTAMIATVVVNLGVFKNAGFITGMIADIGLNIKVIEFVLPIGISFYTFQGLSYVIDVYRGDAKVQKNPLNVCLYIALFPQLVAGPIVRYTTVEAELSSRVHTVEDVSAGAVRFMLGFSKKMIMANPMGEIADSVFLYVGSDLLSAPLAWVGALAYAFQIYFDFSAYSDMAIGLGRIFGFRFNENFNYPYIARSITDFWRRWHISLSTWFRDYVYIPLGGNRCSVLRHIFNLSVVWFLTGMWHGASWNFILWGVYYGALLILEKYVFSGLIKKIPSPIGHVLTIFLVIIGWVFFRAETLSGAISYLLAMFGSNGGDAAQAVYFLRQYWAEFIICAVGIFPIKRLCENFLMSKDNVLFALTREFLPKAFTFAVFFISYMKLVSGSFNPFIYFQF